MKGICFTFDDFGQWSEHDRSKMEWRMNVGIEWRPSMAVIFRKVDDYKEPTLNSPKKNDRGLTNCSVNEGAH
jgi:hypothetical protein